MTGDLNGRTAVYRLFDGAGALLYVGMAVHPSARWRAHALEKPWWPEVASKSVEWHETRETAAEHEYQAIASENPRYNVVRDRRRFHLLKPPKPRRIGRLTSQRPNNGTAQLPSPLLPGVFSELAFLASDRDATIRALRTTQALDTLPKFQNWLRRARQEAVLEMRANGMSHAEVAKELGTSRARAQQIAEGRTTGKRADLEPKPPAGSP